MSTSIIASKAAARSRRMVKHRALISGVTSAVPLPGLGFLVDVSMATKLIADINELFGLRPEPIARMTQARQKVASQAIVALGTTAVGRAITRRVIYSILRRVGIRITAGEATKYVPIAGQVVSGLLSYTALRIIGERHVQQCEAVLTALLSEPLEDDRLAGNAPAASLAVID
ncbi:hypothetical protein BH09PSE6_BH09PSE6_24550 [soil metagenome]